MDFDQIISRYLDGVMTREDEAAFHRALAKSEEARKIFRTYLALHDASRDERLLDKPDAELRRNLFNRLRNEENASPLLGAMIGVDRDPTEIIHDRPPVRRGRDGDESERRRRRRLVPILLPLMVLGLATALMFQIGGGDGGRETESQFVEVASSPEQGQRSAAEDSPEQESPEVAGRESRSPAEELLAATGERSRMNARSPLADRDPTDVYGGSGPDGMEDHASVQTHGRSDPNRLAASASNPQEDLAFGSSRSGGSRSYGSAARSQSQGGGGASLAARTVTLDGEVQTVTVENYSDPAIAQSVNNILTTFSMMRGRQSLAPQGQFTSPRVSSVGPVTDPVPEDLSLLRSPHSSTTPGLTRLYSIVVEATGPLSE